MTDCDHKERLALIEIWPNIHLILCLFHVLQSWENKIKSVLGHHGGHEIVTYRKEMHQFLKNFTEKLKNITEPNTSSINQIILDTEILLARPYSVPGWWRMLWRRDFQKLTKSILFSSK